MSSWEGELTNAAQSPTGIERGPQGLKAVPFREAGNFQSSLRDFSSLESLPRTASWAKFSRPCGTHFAIGRFSRKPVSIFAVLRFMYYSSLLRTTRRRFPGWRFRATQHVVERLRLAQLGILVCNRDSENANFIVVG